MTTSVTDINSSGYKRDEYTLFDDDELLNLIGKSRDRIALAELYDRYKLSISRFLQHKMCDTKLIEEVYNDVMLTVWNKSTSFRGESKVSTWLFGIAYRTRMSHSRKENRHKHSDIDELSLSTEQDDNNYADEQADISEMVQIAMAELPEKYRSVIELAYFHGYSMLEISDIVACPENTVKTRLFHGRKKLKVILEKEQSKELKADAYKDSKPTLNVNFAPDYAF